MYMYTCIGVYVYVCAYVYAAAPSPGAGMPPMPTSRWKPRAGAIDLRGTKGVPRKGV